jgi:hypothetical protein
MLCQILLDVLLNLLRRNLVLISNNISTREFVATAIRVRDADDCGVKDEIVREKQGFDLGGRDLEAFVFD